MRFLEHSQPIRRGPAATKVAARDIKAAVLREVDGLTNRQIAEVLCINNPADFPIKGDHPTVRKMVGRGRRALVAALGEEGWQAQVQAMKEEPRGGALGARSNDVANSKPKHSASHTMKSSSVWKKSPGGAAETLHTDYKRN
jgi:hypothetical protein